MKAELGPGRSTRRRKVILSGFVTTLCVFVLSFRGPLFSGNFGVVSPGRVFRSAQPRGGLASLIRENHLNSVLNLRGGSWDDPWYDQEVQLTGSEGVDFYDFPMSATRRPTRRELLTLIDLFGRCRYPLLIHCKSGADRTGLASAVYLMTAEGRTPEAALGAFSLAYGHVPLRGPERLHEPLQEYGAWLSKQGRAHSPGLFRDWVEKQYPSTEPAAPPADLQPGPRERAAWRQGQGQGQGARNRGSRGKHEPS